MADAKTEDEITLFERDMKEFWTEFKSVYGTEQINQTFAVRDSCKEAIEALSEKWSKKLKEGDLMIDKIQEYKNGCKFQVKSNLLKNIIDDAKGQKSGKTFLHSDFGAEEFKPTKYQNLLTAKGKILQQSKCISEKEEQLAEIKSKLSQEEEQQKNLTDSIQELKEELAKKIEIASSKDKAAKEKVERLCKSKVLFEERLGLEIRRIHNEQLQFIFRHIDHKDPDKPYMFTLSINEQGDYEVTSCTPPLDCIAEFQLKVRETNNFSAFVANIRKAFTALSYKQSA